MKLKSDDDTFIRVWLCTSFIWSVKRNTQKEGGQTRLNIKMCRVMFLIW